MGTLSQEAQDCYPIWRLVLEGTSTLEEIKQWDLVDIYTANDLLNMKADMSNAYTELAKAKET